MAEATDEPAPRFVLDDARLLALRLQDARRAAARAEHAARQAREGLDAAERAVLRHTNELRRREMLRQKATEQ